MCLLACVKLGEAFVGDAVGDAVCALSADRVDFARDSTTGEDTASLCCVDCGVDAGTEEAGGDLTADCGVSIGNDGAGDELCSIFIAECGTFTLFSTDTGAGNESDGDKTKPLCLGT